MKNQFLLFVCAAIFPIFDFDFGLDLSRFFGFVSAEATSSHWFRFSTDFVFQ
jgi:hypothetical protein